MVGDQRDKPFQIVGFVVHLVPDAGVGQLSVVSIGLECPFADIQNLTDILIVEPLLQRLVALGAAQVFDSFGKGIEPCHHRLERAGFDIDYLHDRMVFVCILSSCRQI